jgi:hypothetical protein
MAGYGGIGWGGGAWGDSGAGEVAELFDIGIDETISIAETVEGIVPLRVVSAASSTSTLVIVEFSRPLNIAYPPLVNPANYTIPGLAVTGAIVLDSTHVRLTTSFQLAILYIVTVTDAQTTTGVDLGTDDTASFVGFSIGTTTFFVGAQALSKIEFVFSNPMLVNAAFTNPGNYTIRTTTGGVVIPVLTATVSGPLPIQRLTLTLGQELNSKEYYAAIISAVVKDVLNQAVVNDTDIFQWADATEAIAVSPLEIPIENFSGEVTSGILGDPAGLVFFSPALEAVSNPSFIDVEDVSVCTRAYDEYHFPDPPDPDPLFTWRPGITSVIGTAVVWAPFDRLGQARIELHPQHANDALPPIYDFAIADFGSMITDTPVDATLEEPIDVSRGGFLNDPRFVTFGSQNIAQVSGTNVTVDNTMLALDAVTVERITPSFTAVWAGALPQSFRALDNLTPVGPGPTVTQRLYWPDIRHLYDDVAVDDQVVINVLETFTQDVISMVDQTTVLSSGAIVVEEEDVVSITDTVVAGLTLLVSVSDTLSVTDAVAAGRVRDVVVTDTIALTDTVIRGFEYDRSNNDTAVVVDFTWTQAPVQLHDTTFSPVGLWQFQNDLTDSSGNGFSLTVETGSERYTDIFPGVRGFKFNDLTGLIYNVAEATLAITGDFTIEMLLNLQAYTSLRNLVSHAGTFGSGASADNAFYCMQVLDSTGEFGYLQESGSGADSAVTYSTTRPPLNNLCHLALTRISQVIRLYIDGVLIATSGTLTTPDGGTSGRFRVGVSTQRAPDCDVASLKLIASGLSGTDIVSEYNRTLGRFYGEI